MKKPSKTKSKTILGSRKSLFGPFYAIPFYIEKVQFPPYPAGISWARNWILTFRKKRIEKLFHINSTCIFDRWPPYRLKIAISQKHVFAIYFCCDWAIKLKFGQVGEQMGAKIASIRFFEFLIFNLLFGTIFAKMFSTIKLLRVQIFSKIRNLRGDFKHF